MALPTSPTSTLLDQEIHEGGPQQAIENLVGFINQFSEETSYKGILALSKENKALTESNVCLQKALQASDQNNKRIWGQVHEAETERDTATQTVTKLEEERESNKAKLNKAHEQLLNLTTEISATNEEISKTMQSKQAAEQQLNQKIQENKTQEDELKKKDKALKETQEKLKGLQQKYDMDHAELAQLRSRSVVLKEIPKAENGSLVERVRNIFDSAFDLAHKFFGQSELDRLVFGGERWQRLERDKDLDGIPLIPTNSAAATRMRVASFLRILALSAIKHIFQPVYLTDSGTEVSTFIESLYDSDPQHAQWIRSVLLKTDPDGQVENAVERAEAVITEVVGKVEVLQPAGTSKAFRTALRQWCKESTDTWLGSQHLSYAFQCFFEPDFEDMEPKEWTVLPEWPLTRKVGKEVNGGSPSGAGQKVSEAKKQEIIPLSVVAQVWPAVIARRPGSHIKVVREGYVLTEFQVKAAKEEAVLSRTLSKGDGSARRQGRPKHVVNLPNASTESFL